MHPLCADLTFQNLGQVRYMIALDQVSNLGGSKNLYVQGGGATDDDSGFAGFLAEVMVEPSFQAFYFFGGKSIPIAPLF